MSETQALALDTISEEYAKYMVHSRQEIIQILRGIARQSELVTAYFDQGGEFFLTTVVDVDSANGEVIFDCGLDQEINRRAVAASKVVFVTTQDRIKIQFGTALLGQFDYQDRPAFRARLPETLLKLQRREYYRLVTPIRSPLKCVFPAFNGHRFEAIVSDISVGGVGVSGFPGGTPIAIDAEYPHCRIDLPEEGTVVAGLRVRNVQQTSLRSGETVVRVGCAFFDIPAAHQAMIQRYIIRIDRDRRALLRGS